MKRMIFAVLFGIYFSTVSAAEPPTFMKEILPEHSAEALLKALGAVQSKDGALDPKTKEFISLGVAAQIPCHYCVYSHTSKLQKMGATDAEIKEAIAMAGVIRLFSTMLNGNNYDYDKFTAEYDSLMAGN